MPIFPALLFAQQAQPTRKVLVLYWYNKDYSYNVNFEQNFQETLKSAAGETVEYYAEYLETDRFPEEKQLDYLHDYLRQKYADRKIDVLVANSDTSLGFVLKHRDDLFPASPVVFIASHPPSKEQLALRPGITGLRNVNTYRETLDLALKWHPGTDQVFVISGNLQHDKRLELAAREELRSFQDRVKLTYLTDRTPDELIAITRTLPRNSIVLYVWQQSRDDEGKILEAGDVLAKFAPSTPVPIYGMSNPAIGRGLVGGYINSAGEMGVRVAGITLQILNGTRADNIPIEEAPSVPVFDWRELTRWGLRNQKLPSGSLIRYGTPSVWGQHREYVIGAISLIVLLTGLVGWLLLERRRRQRSEEIRNQLATIVESSEDAIIGLTLDGKIQSWNDGAQLHYGYAAAEVLGKSISVIVPPDRMDELSGYLRKLAAAERIEDFESVRLSQHGTRVDVSVGLSYIRDGRGRIIGAASIGRDISKRKRAEQALRESEQELQRLTVSLLNLQDTERRRLARELHDVTAQNVFATSLNLARLQRGHLRPAEAETLLADSRQLCEQALQEIRTLSYLLHPPTLDQTGLFGALRWYVEGFVRRSGINVDISSIHEVGRLPGDIETALFRVVQESLTNISRHSGSTTAAVSLTMEANEVILHVTDHGRGMSKLALADDNGHGALGVGIPGMRQRLRQFGGVLLVDSDERGTVVTARVPVANVSTDADPVVVKRSQANA
jgi:PAS domain S-box-containing protein